MTDSIYDFEVKDIAGKSVRLSDYKGKVLLIVNIASGCGQTPQLGALQKLYEQYKDRGFDILAFPSNDFAQEPMEGDDIQQFCLNEYGVTFKVFEKNKVRGRKAQPLYKYLAKTKLIFIKKYPVWNFQKYLIDRNGRVVDFFNPWRWPNNAKIAEAIEQQLAKSPVEK